jgi:hypothetical protein
MMADAAALVSTAWAYRAVDQTAATARKALGMPSRRS